MGSDSIKKRKRNGIHAADDAAVVTKKTKKIKNKPVEVQPDEEEIDENEESAGDEEVQEPSDDASDNEDAEKLGDEADEGDDNVDLPTNGATLLPPAADSQNFDELKLSDKTMKAIDEMGFSKMTAIQRTVCSSTECQRFPMINH